MIFKNLSCCEISKIIEGSDFGNLERFLKKKRKIRFFNSVTVPKNVKEGTFWDFLTSILLQNIKKKREPLVHPVVQSKHLRKKSHSAKKIEVKTPG